MELSEEYYKLGIRYANKLMKALFSDNPIEELKQLRIREIHRNKNFSELVYKEHSYLVFNLLTVLIGLNKEMIEETGMHLGYAYDINKILKEKMNKNEIESTIFPHRHFAEDKYDSWLNVTHYNVLNADLMFNIRNGMLHSEFEPSNRSKYIFNIRNSNYTGFEAEILWPVFADFVDFYFGNHSAKYVTSLKPEWAVIASEDFNNPRGNEKIKNPSDLQKFLNTAVVGILKRDYPNKKKSVINTPEYKINKFVANDGILKGHEDLFNWRYLDDYSKKIIMTFINERLKCFYQLDAKKQINYIGSVFNFMIFPNYSISHWMGFFVSLINPNIDMEFENAISNMTFGTGIDKTSAVFLKLGFVLYRMQCKQFEEIDYNLVDIDLSKINYKEEGDINGVSPYDHAYNKIKSNNASYTDYEIRKRIVCEIIRDSMAHGKIEPILGADSGKIFVAFVDSYKGKKREIVLDIDELKNFVMSEAFDASKCDVKENDGSMHI